MNVLSNNCIDSPSSFSTFSSNFLDVYCIYLDIHHNFFYQIFFQNNNNVAKRQKRNNLKIHLFFSNFVNNFHLDISSNFFCKILLEMSWLLLYIKFFEHDVHFCWSRYLTVASAFFGRGFLFWSTKLSPCRNIQTNFKTNTFVFICNVQFFTWRWYHLHTKKQIYITYTKLLVYHQVIYYYLWFLFLFPVYRE